MTFDEDGIDFDEAYYDFDGNLLWGPEGPPGLGPNGTVELELE